MTDEEFDKMTFRKGDRIVVRHFFKTETMDVEFVDMTNRWINNYKPQQISKYLPYGTKKKRTTDSGQA